MGVTVCWLSITPLYYIAYFIITPLVRVYCLNSEIESDDSEHDASGATDGSEHDDEDDDDEDGSEEDDEPVEEDEIEDMDIGNFRRIGKPTLGLTQGQYSIVVAMFGVFCRPLLD